MNRRELQAIAEVRLRDAQLLYQHKRFDGAYYLAGYVIECALKACNAKKTRRYDFPDKDFFKNAYIHDLALLLGTAGLKNQMEQEFLNSPSLEVKWRIVKDWRETSRYHVHGRRRAKDMLEAVADPHGVFACIKNTGERTDSGGAAIAGSTRAQPVPITAALWFYFLDSLEWRLVIVSPTVDSSGPMAAHRRIQRVLASTGTQDFGAPPQRKANICYTLTDKGTDRGAPL